MHVTHTAKFTLQGTNTYIVGTGPSRLLVDTGQGIPLWAQTLSRYLTAEDISISHVLLTHWHGDHTGGVPSLLQLYPHLASAIWKNAPGKGQLAITDGQEFFIEGATLMALHSPGHSHDHMCFVLKEENAMITGDNILGHGSSGYEDLGEYMNTLVTMQQKNCARGYPAHGAVVADLRAKIALEIGQKSRRERQLLRRMQTLKEEAVKSGRGNGKGSATVEELVIAVHGEVVGQQIRKQILEPFTDEILRKLVGDGKVGFEIVAGEKKWFACTL